MYVKVKAWVKVYAKLEARVGVMVTAEIKVHGYGLPLNAEVTVKGHA